ncbi:helix-turn-helix domain-containing protein [Mucilaginibacter sp.]|uniref:helix-turn-helix domain-containing protein n=1 Tax=Mucilaginibacter sp. TaxID=1882438 RepID=UPI003D12BA7C
MSNYYEESTVLKFSDLRNLIREEFKKLLDSLDEKKETAPKPLSIQQLADRYEVSKATVHNWMKQDIIKGFKMGKGRFFHLDEIEKSLAQYKYLDVLEKKGLVEKRRPIY